MHTACLLNIVKIIYVNTVASDSYGRGLMVTEIKIDILMNFCLNNYQG
jgi:hypothetical protein